MNTLDGSRDEIRLSWPIIDRFAGRFRFTSAAQPNEPALVDVGATNEHIALAGRNLDDFVGVPPQDPRVVPAERLAANSDQIDPQEIVVLMLCGGLSFRSHGEIHPLKLLQDPETKESRTLLDRQLDRIAASPLRKSPSVIAATPMNEEAIKLHIGGRSSPETQIRICTGGLAPRLLPYQRASGPPLVVREPSGEISYNPTGHLEALRWLILSGMLSEFVRSKVIVMASYSNWGRVFDSKMIEIAGFLSRAAKSDSRLLFLAEVTQRQIEKRKGSILVADSANPDNLRLVKLSYGQGRPRFPSESRILMSTNTLYFSTTNLLERLRTKAPSSCDLIGSDAVTHMLRDAARFGRRDELSRLFETSFPVEPHLIPSPSDSPAVFLRAERDLDQLSLLPESSLMKPIEVSNDRAVSLKLPGDFENPAKLRWIFHHET